MAGKIRVESRFDGQVIRLTLNAPKGNVLDAAMMTDLTAELKVIKSQPAVKMIEFAGVGDHFSFGASVEEHVKENAPAMLEQFHGLFKFLIDLSIPTAALVSGQCLGGGFELALFCNFIFADQSARLGQPEISLGVFAPPASLMLPLKIGQTAADNLLLTGRIIKPEKAFRFGLLEAVYDDRKTMDEGIDSWLEKRILPKSASSLRYAVKASRWHFNQNLIGFLDKLADLYCNDLMATHDANEGITSFLERRDAKWENR